VLIQKAKEDSFIFREVVRIDILRIQNVEYVSTIYFTFYL